MCSENFNYILVGEKRMVLCRKEEFKKRKLNRKNKLLKTVKAAFPELFKERSRKPIKKAAISVETCYKGYPSQFDCQIGIQENGNDWEKNPFVALWIFDKGGKTYCGAKPVEI